MTHRTNVVCVDSGYRDVRVEPPSSSSLDSNVTGTAAGAAAATARAAEPPSEAASKSKSSELGWSWSVCNTTALQKDYAEHLKKLELAAMRPYTILLSINVVASAMS